MSAITQSQLGHHTAYPRQYNPSLLFAVPRQDNRQHLAPSPLHGVDIWTGYELSWLNTHGLPQVAIAEFSIPANSPNIIESKSLKLYLNSLNSHHFQDASDMTTQVTADLSQCAGTIVSMRIHGVNQLATGNLPGTCLDTLAAPITGYTPDASLLKLSQHAGQACWHSHLLKSNCPVTGQPDWGSIVVSMHGDRLPTPESLLSYVVSYRDHQGFHEHCVESIYTDLWQAFLPEKLRVYARYVRRGGLDINPWRSNEAHHPVWPDMPRLARQ
jgi:7-cyano-7-deazaguanine reductase